MTLLDEETALLLDARDGDRVALGAFVKRTEAEVWRACARLVDRQSADDLVQEVYVRVMRSLPGFEGRSRARTWLFTIVRRTCADALRHRTRRHRLLDRITGAGPPRPGPDPSGESALLGLVDALAPERREAFVLTQLAGLSYEEAAAACGCPVGTIRSRVARARADLVVSAGLVR
jgi:RNA polymerase sigma-70 factor, ECF subfamily